MQILENPYRHAELPERIARLKGEVAHNPAPVRALLERCPAYTATPLVSVPALAKELEIAILSFKDERARMGLGSFKALGAAHVIARDAAKLLAPDASNPNEVARALVGETYVAASAGNHGLSVAAGARVFGAKAVIYLARTVPQEFAQKLQGYGAEVVVEGADYEASMTAASACAEAKGWTLLSDSTWDGYSGGLGVMEGYLAMAAEVADEIASAPSHIFLQAGVGGLAAAIAAHARVVWGVGPTIIVVEPDAAPALFESIRQAGPVHADGPVSAMGRLDCKDPSHSALRSLARDADFFMTISEQEAATAIAGLEDHGLATSPSGGAGFAGLVYTQRDQFGLDGTSHVLIYLSEGAVDA